ncbi:YCF48-related protein [Variovorax sp. LjRoot130]
MQRRWRNALAGLLIALLATATWFASQQQPHPDMFRPIGLWDIARAEWWAHPLERNAFKRTVVRGGLAGVFALPDGDQVWAVGSGGLILRSSDGGRHWTQQRPALPPSAVPAAARIAGARSLSDLLPNAHADTGRAIPRSTLEPDVPAQSPTSSPQLQRQQPQTQQQEQQPIQTQTAQPQEQIRETPDSGQNKAPPAANALPSNRQIKRTPPAANPPSAVPLAVTPLTAPPRPPAAAPTTAPERLPEAPRADAKLNAVYFVTASTGWAVGDRGTVLTTRDGGSTWVAQSSGVDDDLRDVQFSSNGQQGWAVGWSERVIITSDGGTTWSVHQTKTGEPLRSLHIASDGKKGWAVGRGGSTVYFTTDGGINWKPQKSGIGKRLYAVQFADDQKGWAVGSDGAVVATMDGGETWNAQPSGSDFDLLELHVAKDGQRAWAVGTVGTVIATRDGGKTWKVQDTGTNVDIVSAHFARNGLDGWVVGEDATVLGTRDGGDTWVAQTAGIKADLYALHFASDARRAWAVGGGGTVLVTRDGGNTWVPQASGTLKSLGGVHFNADGLRGHAAGQGGTLLATQDGGSTWSAQNGAGSQAMTSIRFAQDGRRGWAAGASGTVISTWDGGGTWTLAASNSPSWLRDMHIDADGERGWIAGSGGTLLATRDGGSTWFAQASNSANLTAVHFADDGLRGLAAGAEGTILATLDGGGNWSTRTTGSKAPLSRVRLAGNGQRAWAVGTGGSILTSRDGGTTWSAQNSGTRSRLRDLHVAGDGSHGWAIGDDGTVLATSDGGNAWRETAPYRRYWAPWYFAATAAVAFLLAALYALVEPSTLASYRPVSGAVPQVSASRLLSDRPIADKQEDKLGYSIGVDALSSFIRNRDTQPRVTIAVTGEWGTGKSSIMRMLQTDLQKAGFRTAWFNAWHQQQEGRQLTALFNTVRTQAVPSWWSRQFIAALRVRSRLIWGRGWFYKTVAVASAIGLALLLGDLLADGPQTAWSHVRANFSHSVLQQQKTAITGASLAKLDPFQKPSAAAAATPGAGAVSPASVPTAGDKTTTAAAKPDPCIDDAQRRMHRKAEPVRLAVYCDLKRNFLWDHGEDGSHCGVDRPEIAEPARRCIFDSAADLIATLNKHDKDGVSAIWPSEEKAIRAAAETLPPPPLFRWLESSLLGGLAGFIALLFTKGVSVYGLQMTAPLRALLASGDKDKDAGKEAAGTIERYRAEFGLLCKALDGRLVIFIDDLDRCTPATVNTLLEMTNYLVDVGDCFVVIGAAVERVKRSIISPVTNVYDEKYADDYLRKLIHIELPVPLRRANLENLLRENPPPNAVRIENGSAARREGAAWLLALLVVAVLVCVFFLGSWLHASGDGEARDVLPRPMSAERLALMAPFPPGVVPRPDPTPTIRVERAVADVGVSAPTDAPWPWLLLLPAALLIGAGLGWRWLQRNRGAVFVALGGAIRPVDSGRFMQALRVWNPVVVEHDPTPRHVKRFFNRARLFASYEIEEARTTHQEVTDDATLVMMAALHHVNPAYLETMQASVRASEEVQGDLLSTLGQLPSRFGVDPPPVVPDATPSAIELARSFAECFVEAWRKHLSSFDPRPTAAQILRFADRVRGINVR